MSAALRVARLSLRGFRNLQTLSLEPGPRFNVFAGDNGAGKSNLLEALDYVATLESFRNAKTDDLISVNADACLMDARVMGDVVAHQVRIGLKRDAARELSMDGKRPKSITAWRAVTHSVLFHPGHVELPASAPELRRAFLDRVLGQIDPTYANALATYTKALRSRNRLLKTEDVDKRSVTAYDDLLASSGSVIGVTREKLVQELSPRTTRAFEIILGETARLSVQYKPRVEPTFEALRAALAKSIDKDLARKFTAEGPHADDLSLSFDARHAKHAASKGQHRAIVLALKIAELEVLAARVGKMPILLLDDVSSELDRAKNKRLFELLATLGGQVFLTTTHPEFILLDQERVDFRVEGGTVSRV